MALEDNLKSVALLSYEGRKFSRRTFFTVLGATITGSAVLENEYKNIIREQFRQHMEHQPVQETEVSKYSEEIVLASIRLSDRLLQVPRKYPILLPSILGGTVIGWQMRSDTGKQSWQNRGRLAAASIGCMTVNRLCDDYSTLDFITLMEDPRFIEYGFNQYFAETNKRLGYRPGRYDLISKRTLFEDLGMICISVLVPPVGIAFGFSAPVIYANNTSISNTIAIGYRIGDQVKEKIKESWADQQIKEYIRKITPNDLK